MKNYFIYYYYKRISCYKMFLYLFIYFHSHIVVLNLGAYPDEAELHLWKVFYLAIERSVHQVHANLSMADLLGTGYYRVDSYLATLRGEIDHRFAQVNQRFDAMAQRFDAIDQRLDAMAQRFDHLEGGITLILNHLNIQLPNQN